MESIKQWERHKEYLNFNPEIGLMVDISRMMFPDDYFDRMGPPIQRAFQDMEAIESGADRSATRPSTVPVWSNAQLGSSKPDDLGKGLGVVDREIGQHFPVNVQILLVQP